MGRSVASLHYDGRTYSITVETAQMLEDKLPAVMADGAGLLKFTNSRGFQLGLHFSPHIPFAIVYPKDGEEASE